MGIGDLFKDKKTKEADEKADRSAALRAEAMENARKAREAIGEETLQKIADKLAEKQKSEVERAKNSIKAMDQARVADHIKSLLKDK